MKGRKLKGEIKIENPLRLMELEKLNRQVDYDAKYRRKKYQKYLKNQDEIKQKIRDKFPDIKMRINLNLEEQE